MWIWVSLALVGLVAIVLAVAATRPAEMVVERSGRVDAAPERVFALIDDFRAWTAWSPWEGMDPAMHREYGGEPRGVGTTYYWRGNKKVGEGRMAIEAADAPHRIEIKLEFLRPWRATNPTVFRIERDGTGSRVTWTMRSKSPLVMRVMGLFVSFDQLIGRDFERGLAGLAKAARNA